MFKRIIPCILVLAIVFSFAMPVHAFAADEFLGKLSGLDDALTSMFDNAALAWQYDANTDYYGCSQTPDGKHILEVTDNGLVVTGECAMCHQGIGQVLTYYYQGDGDRPTYNDYIAENYPLDGYGSDGGFYWYPTFNDFNSFTFRFYRDGSMYDINFFSTSCTGGVFSTPSIHSDCKFDNFIYSDRSLVFDIVAVNAPISFPRYLSTSGILNIPVSGRYYYTGGVSFYTYLGNSNYGVDYFYSDAGTYSFSHFRYYDNYYIGYNWQTYGFVLPVFRVQPLYSVETNYYAYNTRIGSVNFNLATKQGDNITNVYQDVTIVNEETNVYTDPTTGTQQNIKSWTYDYTTRTYHLTLEDGSLLDVEFGDNSIQVKLNGEITQEYYYTVENEPDPTPTPEVPPTTEPEVTPTPDPGTGPTPTPGPGGPGGGDDDNSFFDWLKQWLIDFKTWLAEKFDALGAGDVSAGDTNITIEGDTTNDVDIHYTDESGEEKETSLLSLIHKFGFLHDIYDIGRTLFSLVATDASAAYAYDPDSPLPMGADDGPAANGAPTLTLDLGVAQSVYGWDYGGEVQILDLSWYTPYKETVDNIMSGFLWLLFAWGLFKQAPSIISGGGIIANKSEDISDGKRGR